MLRFRTFAASDADIIKDWTDDEYAFRLWSADRYDHYPISGKDICDNYESQSGTLFPFPVSVLAETIYYIQTT